MTWHLGYTHDLLVAASTTPIITVLPSREVSLEMAKSQYIRAHRWVGFGSRAFFVTARLHLLVGYAGMTVVAQRFQS